MKRRGVGQKDSSLRIPSPLGHEVLDTQHRLLFEMVIELEDAINAGNGEELLADWLDRAWAYMAVHFAAEERLMVETNYPNLLEHRKAHDIALGTLRKLDSVGKAPVEGAAVRTLHFVWEWEVDHVNGPDRVLAQFLLSPNSEVGP
jgi:hemerythrin